MSAAGPDRIARLLWRAGFGPRPGEVERLSRRSLESVVDDLLHPRGSAFSGRPARVEGAPLDPVNAWGHDVLWWLDRAVRTRHPLRERMTFTWHDHFATSNAQVGDTRLMLAQYRTLRAGALGSFRDLAKAMAQDHAMQSFLSLANSRKEAPNENFARELFELFTLGVNNGYTETDVREASRALTGYTYDWDSRRFGYDPARHDDGGKTILGRTGRFAPLDVVDIAIDHPAHAPFLCTKLWGYFSPRPVPARLLKRMVAAYRRSGTQIRPVLREILTSKALYEDLDAPDMVKPPFVYLAGMMRATGYRIHDEQWSWRLEQMGQVPFRPPNVGGWQTGTAWLSTSTTKARFDAATALLYKTVREGSVLRRESAERAVERALEATGRPRTGRQTRRALTRYAVQAVAGRTDDWEVEHYWPERQRVLRHLLLAGPEAQVC